MKIIGFAHDDVNACVHYRVNSHHHCYPRKGDNVALVSLGEFVARKRAACTGRNLSVGGNQD
jgi:nucleoid DNA-binding protein